MKGDIAFVGFMLTADEWQELDPQSRAQLIAVATRRVEPALRFPEGTGKHEVLDVIDDELDADDADSNLEPVSSTPTLSSAVGGPSAVDAGWEDFADLDAI